MIFFRAHPVRQIVDVVHGVAAVALAYDPGGVVQTLRARQFNDLAEFRDPLIAERAHVVNQARLNGVIDRELSQPRQCLCET